MPPQSDLALPYAFSLARNRVVKRAFDILGATVLLAASSPLLLLSALAVKLTSRGPVLFGHRRCGKGGRSFICLKFRTMVADAEAWLDRDPELREEYRRNGFKLPRNRDPRVTQVGHVLRFTHLDELPQLLNVLRGQMSLVGPRPVVQDELEWYDGRRNQLLSVKPGIFGPWTAQGRRRPDYPERVDVELSYTRKMSFLKDIEILVRNVPVVFTGQVEEDPGPVEGDPKEERLRDA